jgi:hypothetical protein
VLFAVMREERQGVVSITQHEVHILYMTSAVFYIYGYKSVLLDQSFNCEIYDRQFISSVLVSRLKIQVTWDIMPYRPVNW